MSRRLKTFLAEGSYQQHLMFLFGLALLLIAVGMGLRSPWPADEPRYALVAKEMVDSGRWLFPHVAGVLYPDKPPLYFWIMASLYAVFGSIRWTFLLPSLMASLGTVWLVYDLGGRLWRRSTGLVAATLLLLCLQFTLQGRSAQIDATVTFFITMGIYGLLRHLLVGPSWRWFYIACAAMAAGVITKGVGFLPLLVFIPWGVARYRDDRMLPQLHSRPWQWLLGLPVFMAVVSVWLVPMLSEVMTSTTPELVGYRNDILFKQTGERYADSWHHIEPFWYYLVNVIPVFWFPLSALLPWLVPAWWRRVKRKDPRFLLPVVWALLVLLFFSVSPGKRGVYILPALPMLVLAAAPLLRGILSRRAARNMLWWLAFVTAMAIVAAITFYLLVRPEEALEQLAPYGARAPWIFLGLLGGGGGLLLMLLRKRAVTGVALYIMWIWLLLGTLGYSMLEPQRSPATLMTEVRQDIGDAQLGLVYWKEQLVLQAGRPVVHFGFRRNDDGEMNDALGWLAAGQDRVLLVGDVVPKDCVNAGQVRNLGLRHGRDWYLIEHNDLKARCLKRLSPPDPAQVYVVDYLTPYR